MNKTEISKEVKKKRGGDNGKRKPIIDNGIKWCNCTRPKLTSNAGGAGQAYCLLCGNHWYN